MSPSDAGARPFEDPALYVRWELRDLPPYTLDQPSFRHKLDQNEVPWDLPQRFKREVVDRLLARNWAHYPDFHSDRLRRALGRLHFWPWEGILVGNGSSELLGVLLDALVGPGRQLLSFEPSFGLYELYVRRSGGEPHFLPPTPDLTIPLEELTFEIASQPERPVLLCSPNNPTGKALSPQQIERLLEALEAPLIIDNAYAEFCRWDYRPLLDRFPNLILLRTFSKAWSLAGMRLGYLLADPALVRALLGIKLPYNVSHAAAVAGEVALENREIFERMARIVRGRRAQWCEMLRRKGLQVFDSEGNFLLVRSADSQRLQRGLAERGILVRNMGGYAGLGGCFRIAVGSGAALRATERALEELLS